MQLQESTLRLLSVLISRVPLRLQISDCALNLSANKVVLGIKRVNVQPEISILHGR